LAGGSGALGLTAATSGTLFMATANPATLMVIGNGVGSAVMGAGGIVAQAPFLPVAGALMPVAAPLLAFQALSTIMILQQFESINKKLVNIEKTLNRVLQRNEATFIGEVISASTRLESIEKEFAVANYFSQDMIIRLALVEDKVNPIFERYKYLYEAQDLDQRLTSEDLGFKQTDASMAIVLSILDMRIDILRTKLTLQENPGFMKGFAEILVEKVERYKKLWTDIENSPKRVAEVSQSMSQTVSEMNWWQKQMPGWLGGKRKQRIEIQNNVKEIDEKNSYINVIDTVESAKSAISLGQNVMEQMKIEQQTLLYWEDENGINSYYTSDVLIK
ncbi:MAG TPA: hypothetical protein PKH91_07960, partial [Flavobacterium sp.]|nr:hypothetical protein [Flavobacterium sp.]